MAEVCCGGRCPEDATHEIDGWQFCDACGDAYEMGKEAGASE